MFQEKHMFRNGATASGNAMWTVHEVEITIRLSPNQDIYCLLSVPWVLAEKVNIVQDIGSATAVKISTPYFQCRYFTVNFNTFYQTE